MQPCSVHSQTAPPIQAETFLSPFPNCLYYLVSTTLVFPSLLPLAFICIINWIYLCEETLRGLDSAKRVNNFYHQYKGKKFKKMTFSGAREIVWGTSGVQGSDKLYSSDNCQGPFGTEYLGSLIVIISFKIPTYLLSTK